MDDGTLTGSGLPGWRRYTGAAWEDIGKSAKEFVVEARYTSGNYTTFGQHPPKAIGIGGDVYYSFVVPDDFASLISIEVIGMADSTETIQFDVTTDFGVDGEDYFQNQDSLVDEQKAVVQNKIWFHDVSGAVTGIFGGDLVGIEINSDTDFLYITLLRFKYST